MTAAINRREFVALFMVSGFGLLHGPSLFEKITRALDAWQHNRRRPDELGYENDVADYLDTLGFDVQREAGVIVGDVAIEVWCDVTKFTEVDRAIHQLETWPGPVVVMVCRDHRPDLLARLDAKVSSLQARGRTVAMVVRGRAT